jgi:hypothetical protein
MTPRTRQSPGPRLIRSLRGVVEKLERRKRDASGGGPTAEGEGQARCSKASVHTHPRHGSDGTEVLVGLFVIGCVVGFVVEVLL